MAPSQVDGCSMVNLDDMLEAVDKQMQTSEKQQKLSKERKGTLH
jgi:uncharacterized protein YvpB